MSSYLDDVLTGTALWTDIDDYVAAWHEGSDPSELHEFLGLTSREYSLWVEQPRSLRQIIRARSEGCTVEELVSDEHAIAARGLDPADMQRVRQWLRETGRLGN